MSDQPGLPQTDFCNQAAAGSCLTIALHRCISELSLGRRIVRQLQANLGTALAPSPGEHKNCSISVRTLANLIYSNEETYTNECFYATQGRS